MISSISPQVLVTLFCAALLAHIVQIAYYWARLPNRIAVHYDIEGEPSQYWPKALFVFFWAVLVATIACFSYFTHPGQSLSLGVVIIVFLLAVMQLLINANLRGGRLSMLSLIVVIVVFLGFIQATINK